jgi:hypothetical protein
MKLYGTRWLIATALMAGTISYAASIVTAHGTKFTYKPL